MKSCILKIPYQKDSVLFVRIARHTYWFEKLILCFLFRPDRISSNCSKLK